MSQLSGAPVWYWFQRSLNQSKSVETCKCSMRELNGRSTPFKELAQLAGAKEFSKLDANSGFWQIPLAVESHLLTTFITPFGRFCFNRLPFWICSASGHFQKQMSRFLEGLWGSHAKSTMFLSMEPVWHDSQFGEVLLQSITASFSDKYSWQMPKRQLQCMQEMKTPTNVSD